jgi:hypothetical protein
LSDAQKVARVETAKGLLRILQELERNDFAGIVMVEESWFQHTTASSKIFTRSAADVIPRTRHEVGAKETMITLFFTAKKLIVLDVLPRGSMLNQLHFANCIFPDLITANLIFRRQKTRSTF